MLIVLIVVIAGFASKVRGDELAKLSVTRLTMKNDNYGNDQTSGFFKRHLKFTKKTAASLVKMTYVDTFRTHDNYDNGKWCRWSIMIDGKDCALPVYNTLHATNSSDNDHAPYAIVGTCAGIKAGSHTMTIALTRSTGADCFTGWSASSAEDAFFMEVEELNPAGQITTAMRKVAEDDRDSGVVTGRTLQFSKRTDTSQLRITWGTNLRVRPRNNNGDAHCSWELHIDGQSCTTPSKIGVSMQSQGNDQDHIPVHLVGWCRGIKKGQRTITVQVSAGTANSDCYTGWASNDYMEVWEPTTAEEAMMTYMQKVDTDNGLDQGASVLASSFTKKSSSSSVRILYYDNLRVHGSNKWCRWEIKVDGKSCPVPVAASVYTKAGDDDYYANTILGECPGLAAGKYNINIALTRSSGADCHTGHTPSPFVMHALIEVQETSPTYVFSCNVANSNKKPGAACACLPGFLGTITWKGGLAVGPCMSTTASSVTTTAATTAATTGAPCFSSKVNEADKCGFSNDGVPADGRPIEECRAACLKNPACTGIQYLGGYKNCDLIMKICDFHNTFETDSPSEWVVESRTCFDGASCFSSRVNEADKCGFSNDGAPTDGRPIEDCRAACRQNPACTGIQYLGGYNNCDLIVKSCDFHNAFKTDSPGGWLVESRTCFDAAKMSVARLTTANVAYDGDQTDAIPLRHLEFTKKTTASLVKVTYVDTFRIYGYGKWCRWSIMIDGKVCALPVYNTLYATSSSDNDHAPHAIVGTCAGIEAGSHTMTIALTRSTGADCHTGWSAQYAEAAFFMEVEELNPAGQITTAMRMVAEDGRDSGVVTGRTLQFSKRTDASQLRITWATNLRVRPRDNNGYAHCSWELHIDGQSCTTPSKIGVSMHSQGNDNDLIPVEVVGWCQGIKTGQHAITVQVSAGTTNSDCYTGWGSSDYMEVWEPTTAEQSMITYMQKVDTDNGLDQSASVLASSFTKKSSSSSVRILYYDNLRVYGSSKWCRWEVTVDGKSCPVPLTGSVYTNDGDNDHHANTILGECPGLAAGKHNINIVLTRKSGADCYTGWTPSPFVMHALIEVQETSPTYVFSCNVDNSNKKPGAACACLPWFLGTITWKGGLAVGPCIGTTTTTTTASTTTTNATTTRSTTTTASTTVDPSAQLTPGSVIAGTTVGLFAITIIVAVVIMYVFRAKNKEIKEKYYGADDEDSHDDEGKNQKETKENPDTDGDDPGGFNKAIQEIVIASDTDDESTDDEDAGAFITETLEESTPLPKTPYAKMSDA